MVCVCAFFFLFLFQFLTEFLSFVSYGLSLSFPLRLPRFQVRVQNNFASQNCPVISDECEITRPSDGI